MDLIRQVAHNGAKDQLRIGNGFCVREVLSSATGWLRYATCLQWTKVKRTGR